MMHRKTQLAAAVGAALLLGGTAVQAQNLTVQLYGQVNRALMYADNETQSKWFHVDGQPSSTRFGIRGVSQVTPGLRAGAHIETEMKSNPSDTVSFGNASTGAVGGTVLWAERWLDAFFEGSWGKINIGQGSGAADDASTIDVSGTGLANGSCLCDWGGAIPFTTSTGAALGVTPGDVINNNDFESRYDRAMYTTPTFGGFRAQAGFGQKSDTGETREMSLWYSGKLAGELQAAIGRSTEKLASPATGAGDNVTMGGSIGWLHSSGFNVSANYTTSTVGVPERDAKYQFYKVGYKFGPHAVSVAYAMGDDQAAANDEAKAWALGYVWNPVRWTEIYAGYIMYSLDRPGVDVNDIKTAQIGTRLRF